MPTSDQRAVLERLYDALNRHNLDDFCAVLAEDCVDHGDPGGTIGRAAMRQHIGAFWPCILRVAAVSAEASVVGCDRPMWPGSFETVH